MRFQTKWNSSRAAHMFMPAAESAYSCDAGSRRAARDLRGADVRVAVEPTEGGPRAKAEAAATDIEAATDRSARARATATPARAVTRLGDRDQVHIGVIVPHLGWPAAGLPAPRAPRRPERRAAWDGDRSRASASRAFSPNDPKDCPRCLMLEK